MNEMIIAYQLVNQDTVIKEHRADPDEEYAKWIVHECYDCGRKYIVQEDLEEPSCPECQSNYTRGI